jgi:hypothetical protein
MKNIFLVPATLLLFLVVLAQSCDLLSDDSTDKKCKENAWPDYRNIKVRLNYIAYSYDNLPDLNHNILDANDLTFEGYIRQINCHGEEADYYTFTSTIYPSILVPENAANYTFNMSPEVYDFTFTNNLEYVSVTYKMTASFIDGKVYETTQITETSERAEWWAGDSYSFTMALAASWQMVTK